VNIQKSSKVSSSKQLRETHKKIGGGKSIFNESAKELENTLANTVKSLIPILQELFPDIEIWWEWKIDKIDIAKNIGKSNWKPCSKSPFIKPDGGVLYAKIKDKIYPILISEAKKQGTNDKLIEEGKKKQSKGNAIERAVKNHSELKLFFKPYDFYPYVIFASGCDFEESSSINDRLDSMTEYEPRNVEYTFHPDKLATVWIREDIWTFSEIYDKIKSVSVSVLTYILNQE
jgi:type II restriction enzyme